MDIKQNSNLNNFTQVNQTMDTNQILVKVKVEKNDINNKIFFLSDKISF